MGGQGKTKAKLTVSFPPQSPKHGQPVSKRRRERILKVWEMHEGGATTAEIAEYFGISRRMVQHDLKLAPRLLKETVLNQDGGEILVGEIVGLQQIIKLAMRDYQMAQSENAKIGFLRVASEARAKLQKLYQETGLIATVPTRISLEEANPFSDPEFRKKYIALLKEARERGVAIYGL